MLAKICETPGTPGREERIRKVIEEELSDLGCELSTDSMGNLIAFKKGKGDKRIMLAAHMDEIGFMVRFIDDNGFVHFTTLGGFDPKTLTAQRVTIHGKRDLIGVMGSKPIHIMKPEERKKAAEIDDFFIDMGMPKDEVEKYITVGDPITRERKLIEMGDCVNCKSLDNRISVFILIEVLKELKSKTLEHDIYATFTVQEEVGIRGAQVAAHSIDPHFGIAIDTTIAFDVPGSTAKDKVTELGKGVAIKVLDASAICDHRLVKFFKKNAQKENIPYQMEVLTAGGTDTAGLQRWGKHGAIAGAVSIPTRHIHQVIEMVHTADVRATIDLLTNSLENFSSLKLD